MQNMLHEVQSQSTAVGLKLNMKKSKIMSYKHVKKVSFGLGNQMLEEVKNRTTSDRCLVLTQTMREKSDTE